MTSGNDATRGRIRDAGGEKTTTSSVTRMPEVLERSGVKTSLSEAA